MRIFTVMLLLVACAQPGPVANTTSTTTTTQPAPASGPRVIFPDGFVVSVEIAADDELRARGLMFRDQLRPGTGMLFLFNEDAQHSFWMKNTLIPLDMIFLDGTRRIVGIEHDVPPCKVENCPSYGPNALSRYVLEVAGGVARQHGLKTGDVLRFEGIENYVVR